MLKKIAVSSAVFLVISLIFLGGSLVFAAGDLRELTEELREKEEFPREVKVLSAEGVGRVRDYESGTRVRVSEDDQIHVAVQGLYSDRVHVRAVPNKDGCLRVMTFEESGPAEDLDLRNILREILLTQREEEPFHLVLSLPEGVAYVPNGTDYEAASGVLIREAGEEEPEPEPEPVPEEAASSWENGAGHYGVGRKKKPKNDPEEQAQKLEEAYADLVPREVWDQLDEAVTQIRENLDEEELARLEQELTGLAERLEQLAESESPEALEQEIRQEMESILG